ncbi:lycopene cyclase family protein [Curtobacterium ammoniigenes]|uniref:lycopene cyclase family protein n=1 Tax=Curtobacterium ammoniigenes TaxID=395387 RepID=UPI000A99E46E|nr:lycopene cyclase family protein [Curtobacterium ammoniigenes]
MSTVADGLTRRIRPTSRPVPPVFGVDPDAGRRGMRPVADVVIIGGGCAGLACAVAIAEQAPDRSTVVIDALRADRDERTWCFWDDGSNPAPEAVRTSWTRWEIRTADRAVSAQDAAHPYRMVSASAYRQAMRRRAEGTGAVRVLSDTSVRSVWDAGARTAVEAGGAVIEAPCVLDARGADFRQPPENGRVVLYQRFVGQWISTTRPVFDPSTVTLMDFRESSSEDQVEFMYVLPISATHALVESTIFALERRRPHAFREDIAHYLQKRWALGPDEWEVTGEEAGCIPMTDAPAMHEALAFSIGVRGGSTRPSTGYAVARIWRNAHSVATAVRRGRTVPLMRDSARTRTLDAVFLRFLRDEPAAAPDAFARMFGGVPGPAVVRFLSERSSVIDELRIIFALPKRPFLRAAARLLGERARAMVRPLGPRRRIHRAGPTREAS